MLRVLFIRHGTTDWNASKRLQGHTDRPLLDSSVAHLRSLAIPPAESPVRWFASPLKRAHDTAVALGARDIVTVPEIIEMDWGTWEGETVAALRARLGPAMAQNESRGADFRPEGGESPREVAVRVTRWLQSLTTMPLTDQTAVAVTHKGVIRALFAYLWGWAMVGRPPQRFDWNALHEVRVAPDGSLHAGTLNIALHDRSLPQDGR